jgi:hypothetical protein
VEHGRGPWLSGCHKTTMERSVSIQRRGTGQSWAGDEKWASVLDWACGGGKEKEGGLGREGREGEGKEERLG